ncbi:unnamed protein product [Dibothriocephalus latus]|uniref:Uncharacterized protein n=1 Tax=Dibothriocephalus latus TaxID=60516 RepID=A0A3P6U8I8_DIBLA|nr:unnamed protein product [Dibothriocephalus latus]
MDGAENSSKINKANDLWLLVAIAEFEDLSQCEYLIHTSKPSVKSAQVGLRPGVAYRLQPSGEKNGEELRSNVDEAHAAVFLTFCLVSLLVNRDKDA